MLLAPLGIDPREVPRATLTAPGLCYSASGDGLPPGVLHLPLHDETLAYFSGRRAYDAGHVHQLVWDGDQWPVLFGTAAAPDLVASAFFWLSGWQEYTTAARDRHARFPHAASLQARLGTTTRPLVDGYREMLAARLRAHGLPTQRQRWGAHDWLLCPTHDIDYLRKWRPGMIYREGVEYFLLNYRHVSVGERVRRLGRFAADFARPGDVYRGAFARMQAEVQQRGGTATYFLKAGATSDQDVDYSLTSRYAQRKLAELKAAGFEIGLHPSYHAHTHARHLQAERDRLVAAAGAPVSVRQHYLRWEAQRTPRLQQQAGFLIDSTLGFAEHEGFRNSTCRPFQLFDIGENAPLDLWEMPLALMESALFNRRMLEGEAAWEATRHILDTCRRFGGACVMLWHNVLWDELDHLGWGAHFLRTLDYAKAEGASITSLKQAMALGEVTGFSPTNRQSTSDN